MTNRIAMVDHILSDKMPLQKLFFGIKIALTTSLHNIPLPEDHFDGLKGYVRCDLCEYSSALVNRARKIPFLTIHFLLIAQH